MKIALVRPPVSVLHKFSKPVENLAIGYLAASLRKSGREAILIDAMLENMDIPNTADRVIAENVDIVGFTTVLQRFPEELKVLIQHMRAKGFRGYIFVGGHAVSFIPEEIMKHNSEIDGVISGEGEQVIVEIAEHIEKGSEGWRNLNGVTARTQQGSLVSNSPRRLNDLSGICRPARDLVPRILEKDGLVAVSTSRGCHARCSFCSVPRFYGLETDKKLSVRGWIPRPALEVVEEIVELHQNYGLREVLFVDDEFFGGDSSGHARAIELSRMLADHKIPLEFAISCRAENVIKETLIALKSAGLRHVFIGLESGSNKNLKLYGKGISVNQNIAAVDTVKGLGLSFQPGFMLFNYKSTLEDLSDGIKFLRAVGELKPVTINTSLDPHFGAPITKDIGRSGALIASDLGLSSKFIDPKVGFMHEVAKIIAEEFQETMNFIAAINSSITYEWRRAIPGRGLKTQESIESFEKFANDSFSEIFLNALDRVVEEDCSFLEHDSEIKKMLCDYEKQAQTVAEDMNINKLLLASLIRKNEGVLKYYNQLDFIESEYSRKSYVD